MTRHLFRKLLSCLPLLAALVATATGARAASDSGQLAWQKVRFEEVLQDRIRKALSPVVPENRVVVSVSIQLKNAPGAETAPAQASAPPPVETDDSVFLEKLDLGVPTLESAFVEADLLDNIKGISISVLYDASLAASKTAVVEQITRHIAESLGDFKPEVKVQQAELATKEPEADWTLRRWIIEFKESIGLVLAVFVLALLLGVPGLFVMNEFRKLQIRRISILEAESTRKQVELEERKSKEAAAEAPEAPASGAADAFASIPDTAPAAGMATAAAGNMATIVPGAPMAAGPTDLSGEQGPTGVEKFQQLLKDAPAHAGSLVKQWIKAPVKDAADALVLLPQRLTTEELLKLFSQLTLVDRREWKQLMKNPLAASDPREVDRYIGTQTIDIMLVPPPAADAEVRALAGDLSTAECAQLTTDDPMLGAALLNMLPAARVSKMMALLPPEIVNQISAEGFRLTDEEALKRLSGLKRAVTELRRDSGTGRKTPFFYEALDLLHQLTPERQESLFNAMAEAGEYALLEASARRFLPSEIILKLPVELLRSCLNRHPVTQKAELIASLEPARRELLLQALGEPGAKLRDMVDLELQGIEQDPLRLKRVERKKELLWQQFVETVRTVIVLNEAAGDAANLALGEWLTQKTQGQYGGQLGGANAVRKAA